MNKSGIYPRGNRVLVYPDPIDTGLKTGMIELPDSVKDKYETAQASGTLVAAGPDAWDHITEKVYRSIDNTLKLVEVRKRGYSKPFAEVGERVAYAKYAGRAFIGKDNRKYLMLNDEDITAGLDVEVEMSDLEPRKAVGEQEASER